MKRFKTLLMMAFAVALCSGVANAEVTRDLIQQNRFYSLYSLQALPPNLSAYNNVYFVSSISPKKSDVSDGRHGESMWQPFATIDYAFGRCVAPTSANNRMGDVIIVSANHVEDPATGVTLDMDVAGVTLWGQGFGVNAPRIDMSFTDNGFDIGANNCTIHNIWLRPSVPAVLIGFDIESGVTGTIIEYSGVLAGEAGTGTDEFVVEIDLKSGNTDTIIRYCDFRTHVAADGQTTGILLAAASTNVTIEHCVATGNYSTAWIDDGAACTDVHILYNIAKVKDGEPGIEMTSTTTGLIVGNMIESTGLAVNSMIVAADMSWFNNYGVTSDGTAASLIGTDDVQTAVDAILVDTAAIDLYRITTISATTNFSASTDVMFSVATAPIEIVSLFGLCTTLAGGSPGTMVIQADATTSAQDGDFSTTVNVDGLAAGDVISFSNAVDEGVLSFTTGTQAGSTLSWFCPIGDVVQTLSSTGTGNVTWYMAFRQIDGTAVVTAP